MFTVEYLSTTTLPAWWLYFRYIDLPIGEHMITVQFFVYHNITWVMVIFQLGWLANQSRYVYSRVFVYHNITCVMVIFQLGWLANQSRYGYSPVFVCHNITWVMVKYLTKYPTHHEMGLKSVEISYMILCWSTTIFHEWRIFARWNKSYMPDKNLNFLFII